MANRKVTFDIEANDKTDQGISKTSGELNKLESEAARVGNTARASGLKFTEFNSAIEIGRKVLEAANKVYQETVGKLVAYANTVRTLKNITGESAEEMSRVYQLTDDYKISSENLTMVLKTLAAQGKTLNIDTLAKMSDEYLKLSSGSARQLYLTKNLGREGADYAEILSQGSAKIREQAAATSESLILNDEQLRQARELEIAQDNLNDSWTAITTTIGTKVLPEINRFLKVALETIDVINLWARRNETFADIQKRWGDQLNGQGATYEEYARKILDNAKAMGILHYSTDAYLNMIRQGKALPEELAQKIGLLSQAEYNAKLNSDGFADSLVKQRNGIVSLVEPTGILNGQISELSAALIMSATDWEESWTSAKEGSDRTKQELQLIKAGLKEMGEEGSLVWQGFLMATGKISPAAYEEFVKVQDMLKTLQEMADKGMSLTVRINYLVQMNETQLPYGSLNNPDIVTSPKPSSGGEGKPPAGYTYAGRTGWGSSTEVWKNSAGDVWTGTTKKAAGGSGIVPPGFNHDNFLVGLSSGERFDVKPSSRVSASDKNNGGGNVITYNFNVSGATSPEEFLRRCATLVKQQGGLPQ